MKLGTLTYLILELNSALDSGKYDDVPVSAIRPEIEGKNVIPWLRANVAEMDLSILSVDDAAEYHDHLLDICLANGGSRERRKWGVENRALCLLLAWTNELVQRAVSGKSLSPLG